VPLTGAIHKRMKRNVAQCKQEREREPMPIKTLHATPLGGAHSVEAKETEQETDLDESLSFLDLAERPSKGVIDRIMSAVKKGPPPRYDLIALSHDVLNLDAPTSYVRSSMMQSMFSVCHRNIVSEPPTIRVRHCDDVYQLTSEERTHIEAAAGEWVKKHGEYSSKIHCSLQRGGDNDLKLCATHHIFQYEVLGRFVGDEMLESEFRTIYAGCFDEYRRSLHSWVFSVDIPLQTQKNNGNGAEMESRKEQYEMLLDVCGMANSCGELLLIEDCRADPKKEVTTNEDLKKENVLFVTIEVNGWPGKFAIAKRGIAKDESLYGHFGDGYSSLFQHAMRRSNSVQQFMHSIQRIFGDSPST